jgi:hypothetical protein
MDTTVPGGPRLSRRIVQAQHRPRSTSGARAEIG